MLLWDLSHPDSVSEWNHMCCAIAHRGLRLYMGGRRGSSPCMMHIFIWINKLGDWLIVGGDVGVDVSAPCGWGLDWASLSAS